MNLKYDCRILLCNKHSNHNFQNMNFRTDKVMRFLSRNAANMLSINRQLQNFDFLFNERAGGCRFVTTFYSQE
jgi:hypothetical protein